MFTIRSVSDQGMDPFICHKVIIAERVGTKVIVGADLLFSATLALGLTIRSERHFRWWHCRCISCLTIQAILFTFWLWTAGCWRFGWGFFLGDRFPDRFQARQFQQEHKHNQDKYIWRLFIQVLRISLSGEMASAYPTILFPPPSITNHRLWLYPRAWIRSPRIQPMST